jgi:hypothetical protein
VAVIAAIIDLVVGFFAGLFSFKIKKRWCPECGATLRCVDCLTATGVVRYVPAEQ